jgi:hypothetical protein
MTSHVGYLYIQMTAITLINLLLLLLLLITPTLQDRKHWQGSNTGRCRVSFRKSMFIKYYILVHSWAGIAQSVERLTRGWTVRASNAGGDEILRTLPDRSWGPPSLQLNGFLGVKWPGRGFDHPPPHLTQGLKKE